MNASLSPVGATVLDAYIFVYAFLASEPRKGSRAAELIESALGSGKGYSSCQVVQEFANVVCKKFATRISIAEQLMRGTLGIFKPFLDSTNEN
jgi:predicted nucleic acid-binding protein